MICRSSLTNMEALIWSSSTSSFFSLDNWTDALFYAPPCTKPPLYCPILPPELEETVENRLSDCPNITDPPEMLVISEQVAVMVPRSPVSELQVLKSGVSFCWHKVVGVVQWGGSFFFALRKRPPDPLTLFSAWRCRDSWRYGCNERENLHIKVKWCHCLIEKWKEGSFI